MKIILIVFVFVSGFCEAQTQAQIDSFHTAQSQRRIADSTRQATWMSINGAPVAPNLFIGDIIGLPFALGNRPTNSEADAAYATLTHGHTISDVTGLALALSNRVLNTTTVNGHALSSNVTVTASDVGLSNVTNESKATMFTSPSFTGNLTSTGTIGYGTGAGGAVSQSGNKGTAVTLNKVCGQITMVNSALAAGAEISFTLNNSTITASDVVVVSVKSGGTAAAYTVYVSSTGAGSCVIGLTNLSAASLSEAVVINFIVIKSVSN